MTVRFNPARPTCPRVHHNSSASVRRWDVGVTGIWRRRVGITELEDSVAAFDAHRGDHARLRRLSLAVPISTATIAHGNSRERISSKERIMYHFATASFAGIIATVLVSGIAFMPIPAEAAKMSNAERVALEKATAACKVEAKGMKFSWHWRKRQKYVQNCIIRTVNQEGVRIDIWQVRSTVNMKGLRPQRPGEWGCDPMC
jgi:hypothetical protein